MCEGVGEDSRYRAWHVDIQVGSCIVLLECVCLSLHVHLGGGVALVGEFIYWTLLTPSWENIFRCWRYIRM